MVTQWDLNSLLLEDLLMHPLNFNVKYQLKNNWTNISIFGCLAKSKQLNIDFQTSVSYLFRCFKLKLI